MEATKAGADVCPGLRCEWRGVPEKGVVPLGLQKRRAAAETAAVCHSFWKYPKMVGPGNGKMCVEEVSLSR